MFKVGFVICPWLEPIIDRGKLDDCMIHAIEARLIRNITTSRVDEPDPCRHQHSNCASPNKPLSLDLPGKYLNPCKHNSPLQVFCPPCFPKSFAPDRQVVFQFAGQTVGGV